jgi:hypothetical protein
LAGDSRLSEKRAAKRKADQEALAEKLKKEREAVSYSQYFNEKYLPDIQSKKPTTLPRETSLHKLWIIPSLGNTPIKGIGEFNILKVKRVMEKAKRAPRSIQYAFTCIQMVMALPFWFHIRIHPEN